MKQVLQILAGNPLKQEDSVDWYKFMGFCDFHRISGYVAGLLPDFVPPQVKRHFFIQKSYRAYRQKLFVSAAQEIESAFAQEGIAHAFLKGTALYGTVYKTGERGSNDIDILLAPESVGKAGKVLEKLGYVQGLYKFGHIERFSRQEIVSRRMNRGETAPYLKTTGDELVPFVEIDLNFSLNWLPSSDPSAVNGILENTELSETGLSVPKNNFMLVYLCAHLYKESTVLSMVKRFKDIELYKYLDIYKLLRLGGLRSFCDAAEQLHQKKECEYALYFTKQLFPDLAVKVRKPPSCDKVIDPENNDKAYVWELDFLERLNATDRLGYLYEERPACGEAWKDALYRRITGASYD